MIDLKSLRDKALNQGMKIMSNEKVLKVMSNQKIQKFTTNAIKLGVNVKDHASGYGQKLATRFPKLQPLVDRIAHKPAA